MIKMLSLAKLASEALEAEISTEVMDLKKVDPAIMHFAANTNVTRYNKKEMERLRDLKTSQAPPPCLYDPNIIRLNILKYQKNHPEDYESQMKTFRELLPNLSMSSWDPNVLELLNNYHKTLLVSHNYVHNDYNAPRAINQNFNRKVSWGDQKQFMDTQRSNIPPYDQKNFFDSITTTTTMRPPRMGVGSLGFSKNRQPPVQQPMRSAKGNCYNERNSRYTQNNNVSSGSAGFNETKSSHDGSMTEKSDKDETSSRPGDQENKDSEPEWFTCPASRFDVIELHGFEDGLDEAKSVKSKPEGRPSNDDSTTRMGFDDFVRYNQQQQNEVASSAYRRSSYNQPTRFPRTYNNPGNSNFFNNNNNNSARYRNPLHQSNSSSSFNSSGSMNLSGSDVSNYSGHNIEKGENPFFEAWKRKCDSIDTGNGKQMMTITDIENALRMKQFQQHQAYRLPYGGNPAVPLFFQNAAAGQQNLMGMQLPARAPIVFDNVQPTREQLQQHTSGIMRNAMLRKQFQDRTFP